MTPLREPVVATVPIVDLRPTQITVGFREVLAKRKQWRDTGKGGKFLGKHVIPVVLGPKQRHYIIDHHHLARALHDEGVRDLAVTVITNLSALDSDAFWTVMDNRNWMHPFDAAGRRCHYRDIPKTVSKLADDPFRSLAGELRRAGGFAKDTTPFSEFLWADFLRRQHQAEDRRARFRPRRRGGAAAGEEPGGGIPAGLVRSSARGLIAARSSATAVGNAPPAVLFKTSAGGQAAR